MAEKPKKGSVELCSICGLCKAECPVFSVEPNESVGPRGRTIQIKKDSKDLEFYKCMLCGACGVACPSKINTIEEFRKFRQAIVEAGIETETNKKMIGNIRKFGNPFGEVKKGKTPKELFCC